MVSKKNEVLLVHARAYMSLAELKKQKPVPSSHIFMINLHEMKYPYYMRTGIVVVGQLWKGRVSGIDS